MPDEFSINLCKLVQQHPEIYNILNKNYHNEEAKNNAWEAIAKQLGVPKSKCVIKWKSLKHQFIKAKKEQNTEWDMWPFLQFCDDAAVVKGGPRKRKRESTATPLQMVIAADDPAPELSTLSKSPQRGKANEATTTATRSTRFPRSSSFGAGVATTQSPQESFLSQIPLEHWRTQASPSVPQFNKSSEPAVEPTARGRPAGRRSMRMSTGGTLDSSSTGPILAKLQQPFPTALRAPSNRLAYDGKSSILSTAGQKEATDFSVIQESSKKYTASPASPWQQATAGKTPPRGRRSTARTVLVETVLEEQVDNSEVEGLQPQQASKESSKKDVPASPAHSRQQAVASRTTRGRRSTVRPIVAPEVIQEEDEAGSLNEDPLPKRASKKSPKSEVTGSSPPRSRQQATASRTPRVNKDSTEKDVIESPPPRARQQAAASKATQISRGSPAGNAAESPPRSRQQATASKTPRGRRSTARPSAAEVVSEQQQVGSSRDEEPSTKRARIEGNGLGADKQAEDALMDVEFDTALDRKFFKRLQEKFAKLRPEVVSTMKANIFRMLDEAAEG